MVLKAETTLVTSYGTVGRSAFVRPDMAGSVGSDNVMKIVPDPNTVRPGYLYSFLSSCFGIPLLLVGSSGSVVTYLDPSRVVDIAIPLASESLQETAHGLVTDAAHLRARASAELRTVIREIEASAGLPIIGEEYNVPSPDISVVKANALHDRLDGLFHSSYHHSALEPLMGLPPANRATVADLASSIFEPHRFKRIPVDGSEHGVPFFGTAAIMRADPEPEQYIAKRTLGLDELLVTSTDILVPRSGQLVGIIGHAVLPYGDLIGGAVSEHGIRVRCSNESSAGYVWASLCSEYGRRQLKARAYGSSIPTLDVARVSSVLVPLLEEKQRNALGGRAFRVAAARHEAIQKERQARTLVEGWIEGRGAP
jgi:type I restriction enzyme S subunit